MERTYIKNELEFSMADEFICIKCKKSLKTANRQVPRQNGGVNYICIKCLKLEKK